MESALAADSVLKFEKILNDQFPPDQKFAFEQRNGKIIKQYSTGYSIAYDKMMNGMVERRMRQSIWAIASYWLTAWINAGQPNLSELSGQEFSEEDLKEFETLNQAWKTKVMIGRKED